MSDITTIVLPEFTAVPGAFTNGQYNSLRSDVDGLLAGAIAVSTEASSTPVAGGSTTAPGQNIRRYAFFTLPSTYDFYRFTGIEWKNGATINGNVFCGVDLVDDIPPANDFTELVAWGGFQHSGISSVQRVSRVGSVLVPGGTKCGVWFNPSSATATFAYTSSTSGVNNKNVTAAAPATVDLANWASSSNFYYVKAYYEGLR